MIGRIHERREFERLNRRGRRTRTDTLWCRYLDDPAAIPPRVAFAIGRTVGPAVVRNRLRRRLRALVSEAVRVDRDPPLLTHGALLIGARPDACERSFDELGVEVTTMLSALRSRSSAPSS